MAGYSSNLTLDCCMCLAPYDDTIEYRLRWWETEGYGMRWSGPFGGQNSITSAAYSPSTPQMEPYFCIGKGKFFPSYMTSKKHFCVIWRWHRTHKLGVSHVNSPGSKNSVPINLFEGSIFMHSHSSPIAHCFSDELLHSRIMCSSYALVINGMFAIFVGQFSYISSMICL